MRLKNESTRYWTKYEEEHEPMPTIQGIDLLKALMEESNLQPQDLAPMLGDTAMVSEILDRQRLLTQHQAEVLADFFHISPASLSTKVTLE
jgi:HTH-type transcriptional regulator / antitoxin HigA